MLVIIFKLFPVVLYNVFSRGHFVYPICLIYFVEVLEIIDPLYCFYFWYTETIFSSRCSLVWVSGVLCTFHHIILVSRVPVPSLLSNFLEENEMNHSDGLD